MWRSHCRLSFWPFLSAAAREQDLSQAVDHSQGETTGISRECILRFIPIILPFMKRAARNAGVYPQSPQVTLALTVSGNQVADLLPNARVSNSGY